MSGPAAGEVYVPESLRVRTEDYIRSRLWKCFPLINVDLVKDIPADYPGPIAVPITFIDKYDPTQFEILGMTHNHVLENGRKPYRRVIIRHLQLPYEEIDLVEWLARCGLKTDVMFVEVEEV